MSSKLDARAGTAKSAFNSSASKTGKSASAAGQQKPPPPQLSQAKASLPAPSPKGEMARQVQRAAHMKAQTDLRRQARQTPVQKSSSGIGNQNKTTSQKFNKAATRKVMSNSFNRSSKGKSM